MAKQSELKKRERKLKEYLKTRAIHWDRLKALDDEELLELAWFMIATNLVDYYASYTVIAECINREHGLRTQKSPLSKRFLEVKVATFAARQNSRCAGVKGVPEEKPHETKKPRFR